MTFFQQAGFWFTGQKDATRNQRKSGKKLATTAKKRENMRRIYGEK